MVGQDKFLLQSSACQRALPEDLQYVRGTIYTGTGKDLTAHNGTRVQIFCARLCVTLLCSSFRNDLHRGTLVEEGLVLMIRFLL